MRNIKIKGKVVYNNYNNLEIIDVDTGEVISKDSRSVVISLEVKKVPMITIEYYINEIEFDIKVEENKDEE